MAKIISQASLVGRFVRLREVRIDDAAFILRLRTSEKGRRFLHATDNDLSKQVAYLRHYQTLQNEWYFIAEDMNGKSVGCIGIYNFTGESAMTGRWIMEPDVDPRMAIETKLIVMDYVFGVLRVQKAYGDTNKDNDVVQKLFQDWGYEIIGADGQCYHYVLTRSRYEQTRQKFVKILGDDKLECLTTVSLGTECSASTIYSRVVTMLKEELPDVDFTVSETMADDGLLDSLAMTRIITALSMEFGVVIPYEEIKREHFNSPRTIAELVSRLSV